MSKLAGYAQEDRQSITSLMSYAVQIQMDCGHIAETDEAVRAAMPEAFDGAKGSVDFLSSALAQLPGLDAPARTRVKNLALQLFSGTMEKCESVISAELMLSWMRTAVDDARATVLAVDEYLAG